MTGVAPTVQFVAPGRVHLGHGVVIDHFSIVGQPNPYPDVFETDNQRDVAIGDFSVVGCYSVLFEGARLLDHVIVEPRGLVGSRTLISSHSRLLYGAQVHDHVTIGANTFIAGFVADHCRIGARCRVFGSLIHKFGNPGADWDTSDEPGPVLGDDVIIGWRATVIGDVVIGHRARVRPGAIVRANIADDEVYG
jgi:UDP-3-O-[3-hydroxymyristoyl] glucosamine N-acyltransferase